MPPIPPPAMNCCMNAPKSGMPSIWGIAFIGSLAAARVPGVGVRPGVGLAHPGFSPTPGGARPPEGGAEEEAVEAVLGAGEVEEGAVAEVEEGTAVGLNEVEVSTGVSGLLLGALSAGEDLRSSPYSLSASSPRAVCASRARPALPRARILALRAAARLCASVWPDIVERVFDAFGVRRSRLVGDERSGVEAEGAGMSWIDDGVMSCHVIAGDLVPRSASTCHLASTWLNSAGILSSHLILDDLDIHKQLLEQLARDANDVAIKRSTA